jgi:hypothetical protein
MAYLRWLAAKQKAEAALAKEKRAARIAKKVARVAAKNNSLADLPIAVAAAIDLNPAQPVKREPQAPQDDDVPSLVSRLTAIREKIWRLQATFAVTLSHDCAMEANRYLTLFQTIAHQLHEKDSKALDAITLGHESLLLSPPIPIKQSIPLATQNLVETRWLAMTQPTRRPQERNVGSIPDGLDWLV